MDTDCTGNYKSNYHTTTTAPWTECIEIYYLYNIHSIKFILYFQNHNGGIMVKVLASSAIYRVVEPCSGQATQVRCIVGLSPALVKLLKCDILWVWALLWSYRGFEPCSGHIVGLSPALFIWRVWALLCSYGGFEPCSGHIVVLSPALVISWVWALLCSYRGFEPCSGHIVGLFLPRYRWKIAHLALNNNHSITHSFYSKEWNCYI